MCLNVSGTLDIIILFCIIKRYIYIYILEIGSCISLTIINVHNNMLKKLPEEIGHLQKLTSLGLIGNKLEYLPIPLANLPNLRALWLTQNQSHPLV